MTNKIFCKYNLRNDHVRKYKNCKNFLLQKFGVIQYFFNSGFPTVPFGALKPNLTKTILDSPVACEGKSSWFDPWHDTINFLTMLFS